MCVVAVRVCACAPNRSLLYVPVDSFLVKEVCMIVSCIASRDQVHMIRIHETGPFNDTRAFKRHWQFYCANECASIICKQMSLVDDFCHLVLSTCVVCVVCV